MLLTLPLFCNFPNIGEGSQLIQPQAYHSLFYADGHNTIKLWQAWQIISPVFQHSAFLFFTFSNFSNIDEDVERVEEYRGYLRINLSEVGPQYKPEIHAFKYYNERTTSKTTIVLSILFLIK